MKNLINDARLGGDVVDRNPFKKQEKKKVKKTHKTLEELTHGKKDSRQT